MICSLASPCVACAAGQGRLWRVSKMGGSGLMSQHVSLTRVQSLNGPVCNAGSWVSSAVNFWTSLLLCTVPSATAGLLPGGDAYFVGGIVQSSGFFCNSSQWGWQRSGVQVWGTQFLGFCPMELYDFRAMTSCHAGAKVIRPRHATAQHPKTCRRR